MNCAKHGGGRHCEINGCEKQAIVRSTMCQNHKKTAERMYQISYQVRYPSESMVPALAPPSMSLQLPSMSSLSRISQICEFPPQLSHHISPNMHHILPPPSTYGGHMFYNMVNVTICHQINNNYIDEHTAL